MTKRSWTSIWTRSMARSMTTLQRAATRAGRQVAQAAKVTQGPKAAKPPAARTAKPKVVRKPAPEGQWLSGVTTGSFGTRRYRLYRPPGDGTLRKMPLLVMLHGCQQSAEAFAASTRMNRIAARLGFIVLYPEQDRMANSHGCWNWFDTDSGRAYKEANWIMATIAEVCATEPVDAEKIAVAGLSSGASMAALLATRHPDRFKAVVMHSGIPPGTAHSTLSALGAMRGRRKAAPLVATKQAAIHALPPLLVIHGSDDGVVALRNGVAAAQQWAQAADAQAGLARGVQRGKRHVMSVRDFKQGRRLVATLAQVQGLGHAWSGGAANEAFSDPQGPDASRMVWAFAARHFRR